MSRSSAADLDVVVEPSSRVYVRAVGSWRSQRAFARPAYWASAVPGSATSVGSKPSERPSASRPAAGGTDLTPRD
jgi:hypothetical protein